MIDTPISTGKIVYMDTTRASGIISREQGPDLLFDFNDVVLGTPRVGETVQFMFEGSDYGGVAKNIVVLSDAARGATERRAS